MTKQALTLLWFVMAFFFFNLKIIPELSLYFANYHLC